MDYGLGNPERIGVARSFVVSLGVAKTDEALQSLAPTATLRVLGHHSLSGAFSGRLEVAKHLEMLITQTDGRFDPVKFDDWMLGITHVSVLVEIHAEVGSAAQRLRHLILMRFGHDDLIEDVTVVFLDPEAADRLYGRFLRDGASRRGT